jgi:hypothetical protein
MEKYATVTWTADDVQTLRPEWSTEKCEEWLEMNQRYIQDRLVELGWEVIEALLPD